MSKLFGTDGIRGIYGKNVVGDVAYRLGNALARRSEGGNIVVGRDTRLSGIELYKYLKKGILDGGANLINLGVASTPAISHITAESGAFGVAITASHNAREYNGLKVFASDGSKIEKTLEEEIECDMTTRLFVAKVRGKLIENDDYIEAYKNKLKSHFSTISGRNFAFDMANGALSYMGSSIIDGIISGATIINNEGDGALINEGSGALYPEALREVLVANKLAAAFAFDGDGDRIVAIDDKGNILSGDLLIYAIARYMKSIDKLNNNVVVGTIYTNLAIEKALNKQGIELVRADVGDSNVAKVMRERHSSLGGERAGHIILSDYAPTGDGLLVALYVIKLMEECNLPLSELTSIEEYPEENFDIVTDKGRDILEDREIADLVHDIESRLAGLGRVIMRASGTEKKLRIMLECKNITDVHSFGNMLSDRIKSKYDIK